MKEDLAGNKIVDSFTTYGAGDDDDCVGLSRDPAIQAKIDDILNEEAEPPTDAELSEDVRDSFRPGKPAEPKEECFRCHQPIHWCPFAGGKEESHNWPAHIDDNSWANGYCKRTKPEPEPLVEEEIKQWWPCGPDAKLYEKEEK